MKKYKLDFEEQEILNLFEEGKLQRSKTAEEDMIKAREAAISYEKKTERINIRISKFDLDRIKQIASKEGLPYQTLISSVLHKYADNNLSVV